MPPAIEHHQPPAFFVRGPSPLARLVFFSTVSIALMVADARLHYLTEVRQGFAALMYPLELLARSPVTLYQNVSDYLVAQSDLVAENRDLHAQVLQQASTLQRFRTIQAENEHLRGLLGAASNLAQSTKLAEIMHLGRDPFSRKVTVNLGTQHGIAAGQAVVDELGVIGQVTRAYPFSSEVTLITDKDLAVPVQVERNSLRAIAFGHGEDGTLDLPYLPVNVDIREGDTLVTSGIDGVYPTGLAVAKVKRVERNVDSPFARIVCIPVGGTEHHRQVLILSAQTPQLAVPGAAGTSSTAIKKPHATRLP